MKEWKILRDTYYADLYRKYGLEFIEKAGFFFDTETTDISLDQTVDILCTPLAFLDRSAKNPCVLLTTGSFCPIHVGHIKMMEAAKKAVEDRGFQVIGGYISPSHDEYVSIKNADKAIPIYHRIQQIKFAIKDYPWIDVDPWEGIFARVAINFTDVIERLSLYLKRHLNKEIPIFYVCGGDNQRFAKTFYDKGHCVIVSRPGYVASLSTSHRIVSAECDSTLSSTEIRANTPRTLLESKKLQLRVNRDDIHELAVIELLKSYFKDISCHYLDDQRRTFESLTSGQNVISIDSAISSDVDLNLARHYDLFGARMLGYGNRPDTPTIEQQISQIKTGKYVLFDDDVHTGNTMRFAKSQLENAGNEITSVLSLNISNPSESEILDARDFLVGINSNSGLVVKLPNQQLTRVPYMYPYVCPYIRASILDPVRFSIKMWDYNATFHKKSGYSLRNAPYLFQLANYLGFDLDNSIYDFCQYHLAMFGTK